ncbi:MAG: MFS transporter [Chloroflexota bacterium]|nr:MFS transporter [Chloroflexota bacterium]MDE3192901.1 MFS transporter [Chloroflexota bacterium]
MELGEAAQHGLLRNRAFLAVWSAQILSMTAANALTSALIALVAELTKSNTSSSLLILFAVVPPVLFGILAGVFVDRSDKRLVLVVTNALRALAVTVTLLFGRDLVTAYAVNFLVASVTVFFVPAEAATLPAIVRKRDLLTANSLFTFTFNGAFLLGFIIVAPLVVAFAGYPTLFAIIVAMFAASAILCATLPPGAPVAERLGVDVAGQAIDRGRRDVGEALAFLTKQPAITWSLVYIAVTYTLVAMAGALAPGYVREVLLLPERSFALLVAPAGIGVIAGLGTLNAVSPRIGHSRAVGLGLGTAAVALVVLAAARPVALVAGRAAQGGGLEGLPYFIGVVTLTAFVFGISYAFITVPSMTYIQEELPEVIRGRVFGVLNMLVSVFSLLPLLVIGPVADIWGIAPVFVGAAILVIGVWMGGRRVRRIAMVGRGLANVSRDTGAPR